jgi:hypothetical protein
VEVIWEVEVGVYGMPHLRWRMEYFCLELWIDQGVSTHIGFKKLGSAVKDEGKPLQKDRWRWTCCCATYACRMETVDRKEQNTEKR